MYFFNPEFLHAHPKGVPCTESYDFCWNKKKMLDKCIFQIVSEKQSLIVKKLTVHLWYIMVQGFPFHIFWGLGNKMSWLITLTLLVTIVTRLRVPETRVLGFWNCRGEICWTRLFFIFCTNFCHIWRFFKVENAHSCRTHWKTLIIHQICQ